MDAGLQSVGQKILQGSICFQTLVFGPSQLNPVLVRLCSIFFVLLTRRTHVGRSKLAGKSIGVMEVPE